jgi:hemolysin activation/secretion protein
MPLKSLKCPLVKGVKMIPGRWRIGAIGAAVFFASLPAFAQVPSSELPGRERERFQEPAPALSQPGRAAISLPSAVAPPGAAQIKLVLRGIRTVGGTVYRPEELAALAGDLVGKEISLAAVYDIAARITAKYGSDGYVLTRAIVPPQELAPGGAVVLIQIVEGYIDRVEWPAALSKYRDVFADYTAKIIADRPTNVRTLERYLLLAGDLPGLKFKNSLKASATRQGGTTLVVEVVEKPLDVLGRVDNRGSKARGPYQFNTSATLNNILRLHEALTLTYAGAFELSELQYLAGGYRQVLTSEGFSVFVNASTSHGRPGTQALRDVQYKTDSTLFEGGVSYPFIRLRERNLIVSGLFFASDDRSDMVGELNTLDKMRGVRLKVDADFAEQSGAINQINVVGSQGINGLGASGNDNPKPSTANGRVDFTKVEATVSRTQPLFERLSMLMAAYGQYAARPLLSPELCGYGGRVFGRGFDPSQLVGDSCLELLAELRYDVAHGIKELNQAQLYLYADRGWLHNIAPDVGRLVNQDAASVGGGIRVGWQPAFAPYGGFSADLSVAKAIDGPRDDWRFFFIVTGRL